MKFSKLHHTILCLSNYNECVQRTNQTGIENYVPCVCVVPYHFEHTDLNLNGWETTNRYA